MKNVYLLAGFLLVCIQGFAVKKYVPTSSVVSGGGSYCVGVTAAPLVCSYNVCSSGTGATVLVADTIRWYKNSTNSTSGGTVVSTRISTADTTADTLNFTPSTAARGVSYYYCIITWAGSGTCGTGRSVSANTVQVGVYPPAGTISGSSFLCTGLTTTLVDTTSGGTWSSSNAAVASITNTGLVRGVSSGSVTISYNTGCGSPATFAMTIDASSAPVTGPSTICAGSDTARLDTATLRNATSGGTWQSSNGSIASVNAGTGVVTGLDTGAVTISYITTFSSGSCSVTKSISVIHAPYPVVSGPSSVCIGAEITHTVSGYYSAGGTWSSLDESILHSQGSGDDSGNRAGSTFVVYEVTNVCGAAADTVPVTVNPLPFADTIAGSSFVCAGGSVLLTNSTAGGQWLCDDSTVAVIDSVGNLTGVASGTTIVSYTVSSGSCGFDYNTLNITVDGITSAGVISAPDSLCPADTAVFSVSVASGIWRSSDSTVATVDTAGLVRGVGAGNVVISYTVLSPCGTSVATHNLYIKTLPDPGIITGTANICTGNTTLLTDTVSGGIWLSLDTTVAVVNATTGRVTGRVADTAFITYTTYNACGASSATHLIAVLPHPSAVISSVALPCYGYAASITITGSPASNIQYRFDGGAMLDTPLNTASVTLPTMPITVTHVFNLYSVSNDGCTTITDTSANIYPVQMVWIGGTAGYEKDWNTATNWSCGVVPSSVDNVLLQAGTTFLPLLAVSDTAYVHDLAVDSGIVISIDSNAALFAKGDLRLNTTINGAGRLIFVGTSAQYIYGRGVVANVEMDNNAGVTIDSGSKLTVKETLILSAGILNTNDSLLLYSDSAFTARVAPQASGAVVSGNVMVMQYIPGGLRRYRFWCHPFSGVITMSEIGNYIDVTGTGGSANGFTTTGSNAPSAFRYNPLLGNSALLSDPGWRPFTSAYGTADSNRLHRYQGMRLYIRGAKGQGLGYGSYTPSPATIIQRGALNQGKQVIRLRKGSAPNQEFNMIGNPYAAPVDIATPIYNAREAGNVIGAAYYIWNPYLGVAGQYVARPIGTTTPTPYYIQANVSYQVMAAHDGDSIIFTESDKGVAENTALLKASSDYLALTIYDLNYHPWDMLNISFNDAASVKEDRMLDARKPSGADFNFYSITADNSKLAIDARPYESGKVIPLGISGNYIQDYIIKAENIAVPEGGQVYLHDKLLGQQVPLVQGTEYRFSITADKATQGNERFELTMEPTVTATTANIGLHVGMAPNPATSEVKVTFTNSHNEAVSLRVLDLSGVCVYNKNLGVQQNGNAKVSLTTLAPGLYMVEFTAGTEKVVQRLIKE